MKTIPPNVSVLIPSFSDFSHYILSTPTLMSGHSTFLAHAHTFKPPCFFPYPGIPFLIPRLKKCLFCKTLISWPIPPCPFSMVLARLHNSISIRSTRPSSHLLSFLTPSFQHRIVDIYAFANWLYVRSLKLEKHIWRVSVKMKSKDISVFKL